MLVDMSSPLADVSRLLIWPVAPSIDPSKLMARLRQKRLGDGLTLEWVADRVGVTKQAISDFETDTTGRKQPSEETLRKWVRSLELPAELADTWLDWRVEEEVAEVLSKLRGPRALPPEDIDAIRRSVRNALRGRR